MTINTLTFELIQSLMADQPEGSTKYPIIKICGILLADDDARFSFWKTGNDAALDPFYMTASKLSSEESTKLVQDFFGIVTESSASPVGSKPKKVKE